MVSSVTIAPLKLYMEVLGPIQIVLYVTLGLVLMNMIHHFLMRKYVSKKKLNEYSLTFFKLTMVVIIFQVCVGLFGFVLYPYFNNFRLEHKYQVGEIAFIGKINATYADTLLSHIPTDLVRGTKKIVFTDHSLADLKNGEGINGFYSDDKDIVVVTMDQVQFEITTHEFLHRLWAKKMNETEKQYFSDMYSETCQEVILTDLTEALCSGCTNETEGRVVVTTYATQTTEDGYYLDCEVMTDKDEEFAYKGAWYIENVGRSMLTERETEYFRDMAREYGFRVAP